MKKRYFTLFIYLVLILSTAQAQDADKIMEKIRQKYGSLSQLCANYTQTFHWKLAEETQVYKGRVCTRNGVMFRIETKDQIVVTDGKTIWTLSTVNKQVVIDHAGNSDEANPFMKTYFKTYQENYRVQLLGEENWRDVPHYHLKLSAKDENAFNRSVDVWVDKTTFIMNKIVQTDLNDNQSSYVIEQVDMNVQLDDKIFTMSIPEGYETVDLR